MQAGIEIDSNGSLLKRIIRAIVTHFGDLGSLKLASGPGNPETHGEGIRIRRKATGRPQPWYAL